MNNEYYVYKHVFANGSIYIGKGKGNRLNYFSPHNRSIYWNRVFLKYGKPMVSKIEENLSESDSFKLEVLEIHKHRELGCELINITNGGEGTSGWIPSLLTKNRMSIAQKGKKTI